MGEVDKEALLRRFGAVLRSKRLEARLSQEKLAQRAGLDRTYVGGVERGERNVALYNLCRLAKALNVEPYELLQSLTSAQ